jgi:hypothetical protein
MRSWWELINCKCEIQICVPRSSLQKGFIHELRKEGHWVLTRKVEKVWDFKLFCFVISFKDVVRSISVWIYFVKFFVLRVWFILFFKYLLIYFFIPSSALIVFLLKYLIFLMKILIIIRLKSSSTTASYKLRHFYFLLRLIRSLLNFFNLLLHKSEIRQSDRLIIALFIFLQIWFFNIQPLQEPFVLIPTWQIL